MREEKRKEMNNRKEMRKKTKEIEYVVYVGNRERRRKEKRKMHFSFLSLICNKKGN